MLTFEVLLVGDAPTHPDVLKGFPDGPVETTAVESFADAIERVERAPVDCVVSDYRLPEWDGIELLSQVRDRDATLPFVLYTADGDEQVAKAAIDADVTAYVPRTDSDSGIDSLVERTVEAARKYHVASTLPEQDPIAADLRLKELAMDEAPVGITIADYNAPDEPLVYVNDAFERITGYDEYEILGHNCRFLQGEDTDPESVEAMRNAVDDGRPVSVEVLNYRKNGESFWNQVNLAPVRNDDGEVTHFVGFQADVTERKEVELRASRQAEQLRADRRTRKRLLARIDGLVRRVTEATVDSTSREELETRVCEAVVETNEYAAAWIGAREMTSDHVVASAQAGCGGVDDIRIPMADSAPADPVSTAVTEGRVAVVGTDGIDEFPVHSRFAGPESGVAAIPLRYREAEYGVLVVYANQSGTLDEHEQQVFEALGRVVGTGINALQNQRLLTTDEYLELSFEAEPPGPALLQLATAANCEITYKGAVTRADGGFVLSVLASGATSEALQAAAETLSPAVEITPVASYEDSQLVEVVVPEDSLVRTVLDHNGSIRSFDVTADSARIDIELPQAANPRAVVETLLERYEGMRLVSQQRKERSQKSRRELVESLRAELTDRQLETVKKAYLSDYFEWPRPVSGEEIATSMGITRSTFHQHLRAAQSKIIGELFEDGTIDARPN